MYQSVKPRQHLRKYIDCFWLGDDKDLAGIPKSHHAIASSKMEILFFCRGIYANIDETGNTRETYNAGFFGHTTFFKHYFAAAQRTTIFGIRFSPLAAITLFNVPAYELTNLYTKAEDVLGASGQELIEQIFTAQTFQQKISLATNFFNKKVKSLDVKYRSVENMLLKMQQEKPSLKQVITEACLSSRQFERHFKELTGFSPRTYMKLQRFEKVIAAAHSPQFLTENKLLSFALDLGYYDQAHFNRHFKEFTGVCPTTYFSKIHNNAKP